MARKYPIVKDRIRLVTAMASSLCNNDITTCKGIMCEECVFQIIDGECVDPDGIQEFLNANKNKIDFL